MPAWPTCAGTTSVAEMTTVVERRSCETQSQASGVQIQWQIPAVLAPCCSFVLPPSTMRLRPEPFPCIVPSLVSGEAMRRWCSHPEDNGMVVKRNSQMRRPSEHTHEIGGGWGVTPRARTRSLYTSSSPDPKSSSTVIRVVPRTAAPIGGPTGPLPYETLARRAIAAFCAPLVLTLTLGFVLGRSFSLTLGASLMLVRGSVSWTPAEGVASSEVVTREEPDMTRDDASTSDTAPSTIAGSSRSAPFALPPARP